MSKSSEKRKDDNIRRECITSFFKKTRIDEEGLPLTEREETVNVYAEQTQTPSETNVTTLCDDNVSTTCVFDDDDRVVLTSTSTCFSTGILLF